MRRSTPTQPGAASPFLNLPTYADNLGEIGLAGFPFFVVLRVWLRSTGVASR